jgi:hypothetical protein
LYYGTGIPNQNINLIALLLIIVLFAALVWLHFFIEVNAKNSHTNKTNCGLCQLSVSAQIGTQFLH